MGKDIYRSGGGQAAIAEWCRDRLDRWATPHETTTVPTPVGATHVLIAGSGTPVVLIPGTNFSTAVWLELVTALAAEHRVVAADVPGQPGLSAPPRPDRSALGYRDWLGAVVRELDAAGATAIGHSLGGAIALSGAAQGAEVAALVLFNPAGLIRLRVTAHALARTVPWLLRPSPATARGLLKVMATSRVPDHMTTWMALVARHVRTSLAPPPLPEAVLRRIAVPVHVCAGANDVFLPPAALEEAVRRLSGGRLTIVGRAGHLLPLERPELVTAAVRA